MQPGHRKLSPLRSDVRHRHRIPRAQWTVKKLTGFEEQRRCQVQQWQERKETERLQAAWELVVEAWQNRSPDELRLQRSVARAVRTGG